MNFILKRHEFILIFSLVVFAAVSMSVGLTYTFSSVLESKAIYDCMAFCTPETYEEKQACQVECEEKVERGAKKVWTEKDYE